MSLRGSDGVGEASREAGPALTHLRALVKIVERPSSDSGVAQRIERAEGGEASGSASPILWAGTHPAEACVERGDASHTETQLRDPIRHPSREQRGTYMEPSTSRRHLVAPRMGRRTSISTLPASHGKAGAHRSTAAKRRPSLQTDGGHNESNQRNRAKPVPHRANRRKVSGCGASSDGQWASYKADAGTKREPALPGSNEQSSASSSSSVSQTSARRPRQHVRSHISNKASTAPQRGCRR